jgi:hypothetical protein
MGYANYIQVPHFGVKGNTASKITSVLGAGKCVRVPPRSKNPSVATKCLQQGYINRYNLIYCGHKKLMSLEKRSLIKQQLSGSSSNSCKGLAD